MVEATAPGKQGATRPPLGPARTEPALLAASVAGVAFPNYGPSLGWQPVGLRSEDLGGRAASTTFYTRSGQRIAYTIVSGPRLIGQCRACPDRPGSPESPPG